jgi:arylsulfatase A-like enzyme
MASAPRGSKPNIIVFMSDDVGWGDLGCYGGGENRGAPTPLLDRLAAEGLQFLSFHGQPSCTPGRAAAMTGRLPIRSGMTTVSFPGQGGGLPAGERTVASGHTPFKGTDYEGGSRVPAIAWWPGTIEAGRRNAEIVGSLDFMATFANLAGLDLPTEARDGVPTIFDSCDQTALLTGAGPSTREHWFYMTETELIPGAIRLGTWKAVWNIRTG